MWYIKIKRPTTSAKNKSNPFKNLFLIKIHKTWIKYTNSIFFLLRNQKFNLLQIMANHKDQENQNISLTQIIQDFNVP